MLLTEINLIFVVILHNKIEKLMQTQPNTLYNYLWHMFGRWLVRYLTKSTAFAVVLHLLYTYKEDI
jgi:hypothetical protein